jgi:hypothetical protein
VHGGSGAPPALGRRDDGARSLGAAPVKQSALLAQSKGMHFHLYNVPFHANLTRPYRLRCLEAFEDGPAHSQTHKKICDVLLLSKHQTDIDALRDS